MKKLAIILSVLCALTLSAWAIASCPFPSGSSGSASWPAATYITGVAIHPTNPSILVVTACDTGDSFCAEANIDFSGSVGSPRFFYDTAYPGAPDAHAFVGSLAAPLRQFEIAIGSGCGRASDSLTACMRFAGDLRSGDLLNRGQIMINSAFAHPSNFGSVTAPIGYGVTKFAGMWPSNPQSMRTYSVNATHTGILTASWSFVSNSCP